MLGYFTTIVSDENEAQCQNFVFKSISNKRWNTMNNRTMFRSILDAVFCIWSDCLLLYFSILWFSFYKLYLSSSLFNQLVSFTEDHRWRLRYTHFLFWQNRSQIGRGWLHSLLLIFRFDLISDFDFECCWVQNNGTKTPSLFSPSSFVV